MISNSNVHLTPPLPSVSEPVAIYFKEKCLHIMERNFPERVSTNEPSTLKNYALKAVGLGANRTVATYGSGGANRLVKALYTALCPPPVETKKSWYHSLWKSTKDSAWSTGLMGAQLAFSPMILSALGGIAPVVIQFGGTALGALLERYFAGDKNFIQALEEGDLTSFDGTFQLRNLQGEPMDARAQKLFLRDLLRYDMMEKFSKAPRSDKLKQHPVLSQYCFSTNPEAYEADGSLNLSFEEIFFRDGHKATAAERKILSKGLQAINSNANYVEENKIEEMLALLAKHEEKTLRLSEKRPDGYLALEGGQIVELRRGRAESWRPTVVTQETYLTKFFLEDASGKGVFFQNGRLLSDREKAQYFELKGRVESEGIASYDPSHTSLLHKALQASKERLVLKDAFERRGKIVDGRRVEGVPLDAEGREITLEEYKYSFYVVVRGRCYSYEGEFLFAQHSEQHAQLDALLQRAYDGETSFQVDDLFYLNTLADKREQRVFPYVEIDGLRVNVKERTVEQLLLGGATNGLLADGCFRSNGQVYAADDLNRERPLTLEQYRDRFGVYLRKEDGSEWVFPLKNYAAPLLVDWLEDAFRGEPLSPEHQRLLNGAYEATSSAKDAPQEYYWFPRAGNQGGRYYYPATKTFHRTRVGTVHVAVRNLTSSVSGYFWRGLGYRVPLSSGTTPAEKELQEFSSGDESFEDEL